MTATRSLRLSPVVLALAAVACGGAGGAPSAAQAEGDRLERAGVRDALPFVVGARHSDAISACAVAPGSGLIATGGIDGTLRLWLPSRQPVASFRAHAEEIESIAFDPDSRVVATASKDGTLAVFRLSDGKALGRARVVIPELPAPLYGTADGSAESSWRLDFRADGLWLINAATFDPGAPAHERLLGQLRSAGFEFSSKRTLLASHRESALGSGVGFFVCPLPLPILQQLATVKPWSRMLTSSQRKWLAISRLKLSDPHQQEEAWALLPLSDAGDTATFDPAPGRLQRVIDSVEGAVAVVRTETENPQQVMWAAHRLPSGESLASFATATGRGVFTVSSRHYLYATPEHQLAAANFDGTPAALRLPNATDVRALVVSREEELLAYATETGLVLWSPATGTELARFDGEPFVHIEELALGASDAWLLLSRMEKVNALDLRAVRAGGKARPVPLELESELFRAAAVLRAPVTSAGDELLLQRPGSLHLIKAGGGTTRPLQLDPSPRAQWGLAPDGAWILEARASGDLMLLKLAGAPSRLIPNAVGSPRGLEWLTDDIAAVLGRAGVALLKRDGRALLIDAVQGEAGPVVPVVFDPRGRAYSAGAAAVHQVFRPHWGSAPSAATPVEPPSFTLTSLLAGFAQ